MYNITMTTVSGSTFYYTTIGFRLDSKERRIFETIAQAIVALQSIMTTFEHEIVAAIEITKE